MTAPAAPHDPPRILAIDWSGAARHAERRIWLAEWDGRRGGIVRLEGGRTREALVAHLCREVQRDPHTVIGLDFAFSFPAWFLAAHALADAAAAWALVARDGEGWLATCPPPFWGRPGRKRPDLPDHFRRTERALTPVAGIRPKSVLQVGGAGAVGTGSLRGMPHLLALRDAGCSIWPFEPPRLPLVVEIYPRLLTGAVVKSRPADRAKWLAERGERHGAPVLSDHGLVAEATRSEDAFDAMASALVMGEFAHDFLSLGVVADEVARLEGEIWQPRQR